MDGQKTETASYPRFQHSEEELEIDEVYITSWVQEVVKEQLDMHHTHITVHSS